MSERVWRVGDYVEIELKPENGGERFVGVLTDITEDCVMLSWCGFANGVVGDIRLAPR